MKRSLLFAVLMLPLIALAKPPDTFGPELLDYVRQRVRIVQTGDAAALHKEEIEILESLLEECSYEELFDFYGPNPRRGIGIKLAELKQQEPNLFCLAKLRSELDSLFLKRINKATDDVDPAKLSAEVTLKEEEYFFRLSYDEQFVSEIFIYDDSYAWDDLIFAKGEEKQVELLCRYIEQDNWDEFCNCLSNQVSLWHERYNPLLAAVRHGRMKYIRRLLDDGASPDWYAEIIVKNEPRVTTVRDGYIHEYAYVLRARETLKVMKRLEMYEDKLAIDVVHPGPRPAELCYPWRKGSDMDEIKFLLWDDGVWTQDNNFFGYRAWGLWAFDENSCIVRIYSTGSDQPIKTPEYKFKYNPEEKTLTLFGTNEKFKNTKYYLKSSDREEFFGRE